MFMHNAEVKGQAGEILHKMARKPSSSFLHAITSHCSNGKLDHNIIRKAAIQGFKSGDRNAVLLGSLLLQLELQDIQEILGKGLPRLE